MNEGDEFSTQVRRLISRPKVDDRLQPSCHHTTGKDLPIGASLKHYIYVIKMLFLFLPKSVTRT